MGGLVGYPSRLIATTTPESDNILKLSYVGKDCVKASRLQPGGSQPIIELAVEIACEGREGRRIGTLFTVGDAASVLAHSRPLILDPISQHPAEARSIWSDDLWGTLKELAQLDGAFHI